MTKQYTIKDDETGGQYVELIEDDSLSIIPIDAANSDYQRYLRHLAGEDESEPI